ncbi:hypothetical protein IFM89_023943 [Coptis chinensis]|uniref:Uncharacterized protein n=1 Tax=Coptis chinensis TaxID=261450 RepID=A0A835LZF9_9MAGN|nr:hypothetical protein IFM89_023943 [Coptis chinensis]
MEAPRLLSLSSPCPTAASLKPSSDKPFLLFFSLTRNPNSYSSNCCCYTTKPPPRNTTTTSKTSYWDSNAETFRSDRFKFKFEDEDDGYDYDYDSDTTRFTWRENRKRKWWSDDDDTQGRNSVIEDVIDNVWFFKVLRSFGWLLPAIMISMLIATGPKTFLMALALPLGQAAVSFAIDKVFGRTRGRPKPRPRTKRNPFSRAASSVEINEEELDESSGISEGRQGYQSWVTTDNGSVKQRGDQRKPSFGGWDELDMRKRVAKGFTKRHSQKVGGPPRSGVDKGKMSRKGRHREAPLLLRLLVAVFPFLGSWARLL